MDPRTFLASSGILLADIPDNPGDTLLHCQQAMHMDFGFIQLMKYVG